MNNKIEQTETAPENSNSKAQIFRSYTTPSTRPTDLAEDNQAMQNSGLIPTVSFDGDNSNTQPSWSRHSGQASTQSDSGNSGQEKHHRHHHSSSTQESDGEWSKNGSGSTGDQGKSGSNQQGKGGSGDAGGCSGMNGSGGAGEGSGMNGGGGVGDGSGSTSGGGGVGDGSGSTSGGGGVGDGSGSTTSGGGGDGSTTGTGDTAGTTTIYNNGTGAWNNENYDWNATTDYDSTPDGTPPDGATTVATTTTTGAWGGFQPYAPGDDQNITGDNYLNFELNTEGQPLSDFNVGAMNVGDKTTGKAVDGTLSQYETGSSGNWVDLSVPLSALGLGPDDTESPNQMYKFSIQDNVPTAGATFQVSGITLSPDAEQA